MTWDVPVADNCPECGQTMFKASGRGFKKPFCTNDACKNFLPEDKRGYKRKPAEGSSDEAGTETAGKKESAKKPADGAASDADAKTTGKTKKTSAKKAASKYAASSKKAAAGGKDDSKSTAQNVNSGSDT